MASLNKRTSRGYTYWAIVESKRVNGKPRPIIVEYLGTADKLLDRLRNQDEIKIKSYNHGACVILLDLIKEFEIIKIINKYIPRKQIRNNLTVGASLILAAIGRICFPTSKDNWYEGWAKNTSLSHLLKMNLKKIKCQHFWDQMDELPVECIPQIEKEIITRIIKKEKVKMQTLLFDTTNYYSYINSKNNRCKIAQRGKNKQKRNDLKQFGVMLLITEDWRIPIFHSTYTGNLQDRTVFKKNVSTMIERFKEFGGGSTENITLIFDQGNHSKEILKQIYTDIYFITALSPYQHKSLINEANKSLINVSIKNKNIPCFRIRKEIWGIDVTVVVYVSEKLREGQLRGTLNNIKKALKTLNQLQVKLIMPKKRGKKRTIENLNKQIKQIIKRYKLSNVIKYELTENENNVFSLKSWVDEKEVYRLYNEEFGRRILITNRLNLQTQKIILSYWCQSHIERVFRDTKNPFHLAVRPQYHWTDQKIIVHNFILIIALLLVSVLYKRACEKIKYKGSFHSLLEKLNNIRLTTIIRKPKEKSKGKFQIKYQLEELEKDQIKLAEAFGIDKLQYKAESAFSVYE